MLTVETGQPVHSKEIAALALTRLDEMQQTASRAKPRMPLEGAISKLRLTKEIALVLKDIAPSINKPLRFGFLSGLLYPPIAYNYSQDFINQLVYVGKDNELEVLSEDTLRRLARGENIAAVESIGGLSDSDYIGKFKSYVASSIK